MTVLLLLQIGFFLFLFLLWLPYLGFWKLHWITVTRVDILVLFLIFEEILSVFHHWEWSLLWVCHIWPLLCWVRFSPCLLYGEFFCFNHKWVLNFVKSFLCIYSDNHIVLILQFVDVAYHINWFAYTEESLHPWDKCHWLTVDDLVICCLIWFATVLLKIFASVFISDTCLWFSFFVISVF